MRDQNDSATVEIPGVRPPPKKGGRQRIYASDKERQAAYRERKGVKTITVNVDSALVDLLTMFCEKRNKSKAQVIDHLLRTQLLRKR